LAGKRKQGCPVSSEVLVPPLPTRAELFLVEISTELRTTVRDGFCWNHGASATMRSIVMVDRHGDATTNRQELLEMRQSVGATLLSNPSLFELEGLTAEQLRRELDNLNGGLPSVSFDRYASFLILRALDIAEKSLDLKILLLCKDGKKVCLDRLYM